MVNYHVGDDASLYLCARFASEDGKGNAHRAVSIAAFADKVEAAEWSTCLLGECCEAFPDLAKHRLFRPMCRARSGSCGIGILLLA